MLLLMLLLLLGVRFVDVVENRENWKIGGARVGLASV
jgi:hypothetical protein